MNYQVNVLKNGILLGELSVLKCTIKYDGTAKIKRSAQITVNDDFIIVNQMKTELKFNRAKDQIQPILFDDKSAFSLGVFSVIDSPQTYKNADKQIVYETYDESNRLEQSQTEERLFFKKGSSYLVAIYQILTSYQFVNILSDRCDDIFQSDREFAVGSNALDIINSLLFEIGFDSLHIDGEGYVKLIQKKLKQNPDFIYRKNETSILVDSISLNQDIYNKPNIFIGVLSNPDVAKLQYKKVNDDPESILSTVSRGYKIAKVFTLNDISSEAALVNYINEQYLQSLQSIEQVSFSTEIEKNHNHNNLIQFEFDDVSGLFVEINWDIELGVNGKMNHTIERSVII